MIIVRAPLRITLGGGGTDVGSFYRKHDGFCITAAIDKYVYILIHKTFVDELIVKYSQLERVPSANQIQHPIIKEVFKTLGQNGRYLEVTSMADIPAGTGLGSSSSFTVALIKALQRTEAFETRKLAEQACHVEIDRLHEPIGKQDQYSAAYGGLRCFTFCKDERVKVETMTLTEETRFNLEDNLLLFFTGYTRSTSKVLSDSNSQATESNLLSIKALAKQTQQALSMGDMSLFAQLLTCQWETKKQRLCTASNATIDQWYHLGMANGALGGKLVGAGGGGFLMFYASDAERLRRAMAESGLREVRFRFDYGGAAIVTQS